jgi:hypothetical protein
VGIKGDVERSMQTDYCMGKLNSSGFNNNKKFLLAFFIFKVRANNFNFIR